MTADKEVIGLSRVHMYYSKCKEILIYYIIEQLNTTRLYTISS